MAATPRSERPLSPHLQIYRPQLTSVLSITHRATGIALAAGTGLLVYWLLALAGGEASYEAARAALGSWFGRLVLFAWTLALTYHLCNGIRHLGWDLGFGLDIDTTYLTGKVVVAASIVLALVIWGLAYAH